MPDETIFKMEISCCERVLFGVLALLPCHVYVCVVVCVVDDDDDDETIRYDDDDRCDTHTHTPNYKLIYDDDYPESGKQIN